MFALLEFMDKKYLGIIARKYDNELALRADKVSWMGS